MSQSRPLGSGYVLLEPLGKGASGEVWRAADHGGRPFAVKLLHAELTQNRSVVDRFVQERGVLASIDHPHSVKVHDLVAEGGTLAIVMELVDGHDLRSLLGKEGTLAPAVVARFGAQVAAALQAAHFRGVIHRDVKPENILVRAGDEPSAVLSDFGVARLLSQAQEQPTILGTPQYFAPELINGQPPTTASDVYALGVTLYELCCGVAPFAGRADLQALMQAHLFELPGRPVGVPDDLWTAIAQMLDKSPAARPTAGAACAYLEALAPRLVGVLPAPRAAGAPPPAGRTTPPPATSRPPTPQPVYPAPMQIALPPPKHRKASPLPWIGAAAAAIAAGLLAWTVLQSGEAPTAAAGTATPAPTTPTSEAAPTSEPAAQAPTESRRTPQEMCSSDGASAYPVIGLSVAGQTSCTFAVAVRDAYLAAGGNGNAQHLPDVPLQGEPGEPTTRAVDCTPAEGGQVVCDYGDRQDSTARILLENPDPRTLDPETDV